MTQKMIYSFTEDMEMGTHTWRTINKRGEIYRSGDSLHVAIAEIYGSSDSLHGDIADETSSE